MSNRAMKLAKSSYNWWTMTNRLAILQGGGPTAVINTTLAAALKNATPFFDEVYGLRNGFEFDCTPNFVDLSLFTYEDDGFFDILARTPGAILGSSRKKVSEEALASTLDALQEKRIHHLLGIGGNGTMATLHQLDLLAQSRSYELVIIGAPKTVDNDLPEVAFAPGFGSAARATALAVRDFDCDFRAMKNFDHVTILETMGRDTGWLAAATTLLKEGTDHAPHIVLIPERPIDEGEILHHVAEVYSRVGRVFLVTNEMLTTKSGEIFAANVQHGPKDSLGRTMYSLSSGTGNYLASRIWSELGLQTRCLRPGSLLRAATDSVARPDFELAWRVGEAALEILIQPEAQRAMIGISESMNFSLKPLEAGIGKKPLPPKYWLSDNPYGISEFFKEDFRFLIGDVDPILEVLSEQI